MPATAAAKRKRRRRDAPPFSSAHDIVLESGSLPQRTAIGDFNSDGRQDLAITALGRGGLVVRLGNGDGTFTPGGRVGLLTQPTDVVVGDFNADGAEDLAVAAGVAGRPSIAILRGAGDGTSQAMPPVAMPARVKSLAVGDLKGDARTDWPLPPATMCASSLVYRAAF